MYVTNPVTLLWTDWLEMFTGYTDDFILVWYEQCAHVTLQTAHRLSYCKDLLFSTCTKLPHTISTPVSL